MDCWFDDVPGRFCYENRHNSIIVAGQTLPTRRGLQAKMPHYLVQLYNRPAANHVSGFRDFADQLDVLELFEGYGQLVQNAPRRHETGKRYFVEHAGVPKGGEKSSRREEHLAIALFNASKADKAFRLADGRKLEIIDYQTPLKAKRDDEAVGKIDLFAVIDAAQACVIELKVLGRGGKLSDTPLRALLEGLAYCAMAEANATEIAEEVRENLGHELNGRPPELVVMAPEDYWLGYLGNTAAGEWLPSLQGLADKISANLNIGVHYAALRDAQFEMGLGGKPPRLTGNCRIAPVSDIGRRPPPA